MSRFTYKVCVVNHWIDVFDGATLILEIRPNLCALSKYYVYKKESGEVLQNNRTLPEAIAYCEAYIRPVSDLEDLKLKITQLKITRTWTDIEAVVLKLADMVIKKEESK